MPRQSQAAREIAEIAGPGPAITSFPEPPELLTTEQAEVWRSIVVTRPTDYFDAGTFDLLVAYCQAVTEHRQVAAMVNDADASDLPRLDRLLRMKGRLAALMSTLSTKMRLTQQSRYQRDAALLHKKPRGPMPWSHS